jgi:hypothetical protein
LERSDPIKAELPNSYIGKGFISAPRQVGTIGPVFSTVAIKIILFSIIVIHWKILAWGITKRRNS